MSDDDKKPIANAYEAQGFEMSPSAMTAAMGGDPTPPELDDKFKAMMAPLGEALGLKRLGVSVMTVEPGKRAFPFHNHHANDELFVILEGSGTYRFGDQEYPVKAGDLCGAPHGGPETAHQLINTGSTTLRYLAISTMLDPEVAEYPDTGKFGTISVGEGRSWQNGRLLYIGRKENTLDYWDGEK